MPTRSAVLQALFILPAPLSRRSAGGSFGLRLPHCVNVVSGSILTYQSLLQSVNRWTEIRLRHSASCFSENESVSEGDSDFRDAVEVVEELLREFGAEEVDALRIASNSPKYVEMLVKSVRELDEHELWSYWSGERGGEGEGGQHVVRPNFKEKVGRMAKRKGDCGVVPLLESVGLKYSSAMLVARSLSSEKLPELIKKVKFVKEALFSSSGQEAFIGRNARRMMECLSISVDEDIQKTLSFYEKMEARHGGLQILGYENTFPYLLESFPSLPLRYPEYHLEICKIFESVGVPKSSMKTVFLLFPPVIFYDVEKDIRTRLNALEKAGFKQERLYKMLIKYPWILSKRIQENYHNILDFFIKEKIQKWTVNVAIESWPHLLGCSPCKMELMVEQFNELGVSKRMMIPVITSSPQLLLRKPNDFLEVVSLMGEIGLDAKTTGRILCRCPEIFAAHVDNTIRKKLTFLMDFGISMKQLPRVISKYPELLGLDTQKTLLPRMSFLVKSGLSRREVCSMITRFSPLLGYSIEAVLKPKLEFLTGASKNPLKEIVEYPRYFSYSLEKKIKPRFSILNSRGIHCSLKEMLAKNDEEFAAEYMGFDRILVPLPDIRGDGS